MRMGVTIPAKARSRCCLANCIAKVGPRNLDVEVLQSHGSTVVHISRDFVLVFEGSLTRSQL